MTSKTSTKSKRTLSNPLSTKANVKKALPNLSKILIHWILMFLSSWYLALYAVDKYGGKVPEMNLGEVVVDLITEFGGATAVIGILTILYEVYRKRQEGE